MEQIKLEYPFGTCNVDVIRKKIKNVHLKVYRDLKVAVSVPFYADLPWINQFVLDKKEWIGKQLDKYKKSSDDNEEKARLLLRENIDLKELLKEKKIKLDGDTYG